MEILSDVDFGNSSRLLLKRKLPRGRPKVKLDFKARRIRKWNEVQGKKTRKGKKDGREEARWWKQNFAGNIYYRKQRKECINNLEVLEDLNPFFPTKKDEGEDRLPKHPDFLTDFSSDNYDSDKEGKEVDDVDSVKEWEEGT